FAERNPDLGPCLTDEYDVPGGKATDFRFGRVFWSPEHGAHAVVGAIGAAYQAEEGPDGPLGLPVSGETTTPDGEGRFTRFENGVIYWSPSTGAHALRGAVLDMWAEQGSERGDLGYPTTDEVANPNKPGVVQGCQGGAVYWSPDTGAHVVPRGPGFEAWGTVDYERGRLGYPTSDLQTTREGQVMEFEGGRITVANGEAEIS